MRLRATHSKAFGPVDVTTTAQAAWTPPAGRLVRLQGGVIGANAAITVHILDGTAAAAGTIATIPLPSTGQAVPFELGEGARAALAGTANPIRIKTAAGNGTVSATFYGREEAF